MPLCCNASPTRARLQDLKLAWHGRGARAAALQGSGIMNGLSLNMTVTIDTGAHAITR